MKICIITFSENAYRLGRRLMQCFAQEEPDTQCSVLAKTEALPALSDPRSLREICRECFQDRELKAMIFVSAVGIAVRGIAPFLRHKSQDPAVLCMDEGGKFCIPILSGHLGGANELAEKAAGWIGAEAVITTASDVEGHFSIDLFAKENNMALSDFGKAKEIASRILRGIRIRIFSDLESPPEAFRLLPLETEAEWLPAERAAEADVRIGWRLSLENIAAPSVLPKPEHPMAGRASCIETQGMRQASVEPGAAKDGNPSPPPPGFGILALPGHAGKREKLPPVGLMLWAKRIYVGIGTRKGVAEAEVAGAVSESLAAAGISPEAVAALCSIDRKQAEQGILAYTYRRDIPFLVYTAEQLSALEGSFARSAFVESVVGIGNVCERAALLGAGRGGKLLLQKTIYPKVTIAIAVGEGLPA